MSPRSLALEGKASGSRARSSRVSRSAALRITKVGDRTSIHERSIAGVLG